MTLQNRAFGQIFMTSFSLESLFNLSEILKLDNIAKMIPSYVWNLNDKQKKIQNVEDYITTDSTGFEVIFFLNIL